MGQKIQLDKDLQPSYYFRPEGRRSFGQSTRQKNVFAEHIKNEHNSLVNRSTRQTKLETISQYVQHSPGVVVLESERKRENVLFQSFIFKAPFNLIFSDASQGIQLFSHFHDIDKNDSSSFSRWGNKKASMLSLPKKLAKRKLCEV